MLTMKNGISKGVTGLLATSLVLSGVSYTQSTASAASPFSDVKAGGWAEKHITKLALQGILKGGAGKAAGTFSPANKVTRQEAVIIALRFMGVADEVKLGDPLVFPSDLIIKDDYKPYIKLAVQKNILFLDEEIAIAQKEGGKEWGNSPATREWIAKLIVRAIGKDQDAKAAAGKASSFTDDAQIGTDFKGYVNYAVTSDLITGVNGKFDPKGAVTREMASTLFSRAESHVSVAYSGQVTGSLVAVNGNKLTVLQSDGATKEYTLSPTASVYAYQSEQTSDISKLKLFGEVVLISNSDGTIGYVEQTSETPKVKNYEGTLILVSDAQNTLTVSVDGKPKTVSYDSQLLTIKDINGQSLKIADLPLNVPVKLGVDVATESKLLSLTVNKAVTNKTGSGTVAAWNVSGLSLQVKDAAGNTETYPTASNMTIKYKDSNLTFDQLTVGDVISYEVKMGSVTSITVTNKVQPPITGVLNLVDKVGKTIQYRVNNELGAKDLADNVVVKIEGMSDVTLDDLFKGDTISMTLNDSGKVSVITISNRSVSFLNGVTVANYLPEDNTLIVTDSANKKIPLILTETTRFDLNGTIITQKEANQYIAKGKKINVGYSNSNAAYVSIVSQYTGTILENNVTARTLKLSLDTSTNVTLSYSTFVPVVDVYGQNFTTYLDLRVGDKVTAIMDYQTQDKVISVQVQKAVQFDLVTADVAGNKIRAKRADGVVEDWYLNGTTITLVDENNAPISVSALSQSNYTLLNVTFKGKTPIKIKALSTALGRVAAVNTSASSIDIVTPAGNTVTKAFTAAPTVVRDGVTIGSLSSVKTDDRVEIRMDEYDRPIIQIIPALSKTVQYTDSTQRTVIVFRASVSDTTNNVFTLHQQAYIHKGTTTLSLSDLKNQDSILLYALRDKAFEIVKQ
ncbi:S-layer homology domain-containing protein [Cohnella terricola]|uniref:S-layer homology domain-containing protein n=1 Tax=Cohnella terricola TaxID=1289167 RepID=A0A559JR46_9BACL|nr:S-layer homology domain-containing protein [Cohnella terricola]TVY02348.1 S-layer homology domain-containing protein [Cohnella terricola]